MHREFYNKIFDHFLNSCGEKYLHIYPSLFGHNNLQIYTDNINFKPEELPEWFKEAETSYGILHIIEDKFAFTGVSIVDFDEYKNSKQLTNGLTVWHDGVWEGDIVSNVLWENGIHNGNIVISAKWIAGDFTKGKFVESQWLNGYWYGGDFSNTSTWNNGKWISGTYENKTCHGFLEKNIPILEEKKE